MDRLAGRPGAAAWLVEATSSRRGQLIIAWILDIQRNPSDKFLAPASSGQAGGAGVTGSFTVVAYLQADVVPVEYADLTTAGTRLRQRLLSVSAVTAVEIKPVERTS